MIVWTCKGVKEKFIDVGKTTFYIFGTPKITIDNV